MKFKNFLPTAALVTLFALTAPSANAAVVSFTTGSGNTSSQSTSLYWNMLSSEVSTSPISGAPGGFNLSDHGDFHFDGGTNQIATNGGEGGQTIPLSGTIDASLNWNSFGYAGTTNFGGTMVTGDTATFGVRFDIAGQTHYGWVSITESATTQTINSWGYETSPNTGILAGAVPEPTSTALFAACGLLALRRTRRRN